MERTWSAEHKRLFLDLYDAADADERRQLLHSFDVTEKRVEGWIAELATGELNDDEVALASRQPLPERVDDGLRRLVTFFRDTIARGGSAETVPAASIASRVLRSPDGAWRADHLARTRSALAAVLGAVGRNPDAVLKTPDPVAALVAVRTWWGVDRMPPKPPVPVTDDDRRAREAELRRLSRWTAEICSHPVAAAALARWLQLSPAASLGAPTFSAPRTASWARLKPELWPPGDERVFLDEAMIARAGGLPSLIELLGERRHRQVALRCAADPLLGYVLGVPGWGNLAVFLDQHARRAWLSTTDVDVRDQPGWLDDGTRMPEAQLHVAAALGAMFVYGVLGDWDQRRIDAAVRVELAAADPHADHPSEKQQRAASRARTSFARIPPPAKVVPTKPEYILSGSATCQELFRAAELVRIAREQPFIDEYIALRREVVPAALSRVGNDRRIVVFADYAVSLAIASPQVRAKIAPECVEAVRRFLADSSSQARAGAYAAASARNDAIALQRSDPKQSLLSSYTALRLIPDDGTRVTAEMRQQLLLNLGGTSVQIVEDHLAQSAEAHGRTTALRWKRMTDRARSFTDEAVREIEQLFTDYDLSGPRYRTGHLTTANFLYTAYEMHYRALCAIATVELISAGALTDDTATRLRAVNRAITTIDHPIEAGSLLRLRQTLIWHTFLTGNLLPAIDPETVNPSLRVDEALLRPIGEHETVGDASTSVTATRVARLTDQLVTSSWNAGVIGRIPYGTPAWTALESSSGGEYGRWRRTYGTDLDRGD